MHLWLYKITYHIFSHYTLQALSSYKSQMSSYNVGDNQLIILSWPNHYFFLLIILTQVEYLSNISTTSQAQHGQHAGNGNDKKPLSTMMKWYPLAHFMKTDQGSTILCP